MTDIEKLRDAERLIFTKQSSKDLKKAFHLFEELANKNDAFGLYWCGICYLNGFGTRTSDEETPEEIKKREKRGFELLEKSVSQGNSFGKYELGRCYLNGYGTEKDEKRGWELINGKDSGFSFPVTVEMLKQRYELEELGVVK